MAVPANPAGRLLTLLSDRERLAFEVLFHRNHFFHASLDEVTHNRKVVVPSNRLVRSTGSPTDTCIGFTW